MKRTFQLLCLAVAALGLSSCTTYVEERGYVATHPGHVYRSGPRHNHGPYYGSSRYSHNRPGSYRSSSRYRPGYRDYDRNVRYDRYDSRHRSTLDTRVRADVGLFR